MGVLLIIRIFRATQDVLDGGFRNCTCNENGGIKITYPYMMTLPRPGFCLNFVRICWARLPEFIEPVLVEFVVGALPEFIK